MNTTTMIFLPSIFVVVVITFLFPTIICTSVTGFTFVTVQPHKQFGKRIPILRLEHRCQLRQQCCCSDGRLKLTVDDDASPDDINNEASILELEEENLIKELSMSTATSPLSTSDEAVVASSPDVSVRRLEVKCPNCDLCDGSGRILGGLGAVLPWVPIKAYRPCPNFVQRGGEYQRQGQRFDEIAFGGATSDNNDN